MGQYVVNKRRTSKALTSVAPTIKKLWVSFEFRANINSIILNHTSIPLATINSHQTRCQTLQNCGLFIDPFCGNCPPAQSINDLLCNSASVPPSPPRTRRSTKQSNTYNM